MLFCQKILKTQVAGMNLRPHKIPTLIEKILMETTQGTTGTNNVNILEILEDLEVEVMEILENLMVEYMKVDLGFCCWPIGSPDRWYAMPDLVDS